MIFLKKIQLVNFLSHKDSTIEFKENQRLLISGASGSGKSSIIESIIWCLYGQGRSENKNLIKSGSKTVTVILTLAGLDEDGAEHSYVINRSVTSTGRQTVSVIVDSKLLTTKGVKETQTWIEKDLLKASYTLFVNSIASPQENPDNFVKQTASKKKDLLLEIAGTDNYDLYYNKTRELLSDSNEQIIKLETRLLEKDSQIMEGADNIVDEKALEKEKKDLENEISSSRAKIIILEKEKNDIESVVDSIKRSEAELLVTERTNDDLQTKIKEKQESLKKFDYLDEDAINEGVKNYTKAKEELKAIDDKIHANYLIDLEYRAHASSKPVERDFTADANQINKQLELIYKNNDIKCPFCGKNNPRLEENIAKQVAMLKTQLDEKIAKRDELSQQLMEWELKDASMVKPDEPQGPNLKREEVLGIIQGLEHFTSDMALLAVKNDTILTTTGDINFFQSQILKNTEKIDTLKINIPLLEAKVDVNRINFLNNEEQVLTSQISSCESDVYLIIQNITSSKFARERTQKLKEEIKTISAELKKLKKESDGMNLLKDAFSPKGIKTIVIDYLVPRLEDKINVILQDLSDFRIQIDTQKDTADGDGVIEGLYINVINPEGVILEYSNYSGGEKMRIDYAIAESLASLSNIKFRILDETINALDDDILASFLEILEKMSGGYKQLIAISHIGQVKELFEDQITITKKDGTSIIN